MGDARLLGVTIPVIPAVFETVEVFLDQRVFHRPLPVIRLQIFFRHVGGLQLAVHQDVIPGLVATGLGLIGKIPGVVGLAALVHVEDDAAVIVSLVVDNLARLELAARTGSHGNPYYSTVFSVPSREAVVKYFLALDKNEVKFPPWSFFSFGTARRVLVPGTAAVRN
jgi:hypothetical protein